MKEKPEERRVRQMQNAQRKQEVKKQKHREHLLSCLKLVQAYPTHSLQNLIDYYNNLYIGPNIQLLDIKKLLLLQE